MTRAAAVKAAGPHAGLTIRVDLGAYGYLGPGKIALMEAISRHGSITAAGKEMGMVLPARMAPGRRGQPHLPGATGRDPDGWGRRRRIASHEAWPGCGRPLPCHRGGCGHGHCSQHACAQGCKGTQDVPNWIRLQAMRLKRDREIEHSIIELAQALVRVDHAAVAALADNILKRFGPVSVLMNNAALAGGADALSSPRVWDSVIGINLMGVFNGVQAFVPAMIDSGRPGIVINTGSKQGITQPPGNTAYNVSKSAVKAPTEGLAHTLREKTSKRITAHLLIPGFTFTGMTRAGGEKPAAAWTAEQVADFMFGRLEAGDFYILCPDNDVTREMDERRMVWAMGDIIENRPALSPLASGLPGCVRCLYGAARATIAAIRVSGLTVCRRGE
jgi:NAD(P)-dependent dehydrogenase (short-subunit alcohol dehydrogenase family)